MNKFYSISKEFHFSASHQLYYLPPEHQCSRLHGHNYRVEVHLDSNLLNDVGFILDYGEFKPFSKWIDDVVDHRHLNEVFEGEQTSAENLARFFAEKFEELIPLPDHVVITIVVSETPKTTATYRKIKV